MKGGSVTTREMPDDTDAVELLSSPPTNDDLDELLEAAAPRQRSKLTIVLVAALVFVIGFLAGSMSEKLAMSIREAQSTTADEPDRGEGAFDSGSAVVGRVLMVDEAVVYVERPDGATVKVHVSGGTSIGLSEAGRIADLAPGDVVIVDGVISEDGSVEASSIQQSRPGP